MHSHLMELRERVTKKELNLGLSKLENITPDKYEILYYQNILFQLGQVYEDSEENKKRLLSH